MSFYLWVKISTLGTELRLFFSNRWSLWLADRFLWRRFLYVFLTSCDCVFWWPFWIVPSDISATITWHIEVVRTLLFRVGRDKLQRFLASRIYEPAAWGRKYRSARLWRSYLLWGLWWEPQPPETWLWGNIRPLLTWRPRSWNRRNTSER